MTIKHFDNVFHAVLAGGTGDISLGAAIPGGQTFEAAGAVGGEDVTVRFDDPGATDPASWELSTCVYNETGPQLTDRTLIASSTGSLLDLTTQAVVGCVLLAEQMEYLTTAIPAFDTVADYLAQALVTPMPSASYVKGYTSINDGGGGLFDWNGSSSATVNAGTILKPTAVSGAGRGFRSMPLDAVDVRFFGAKGDGSTDDTAAIQAALDYCFGPSSAPHGASWWLNKPLYAAPGRYKVTGSGLTLTSIQGGRIFGGQRFASQVNNTDGGPVFTTNGFAYSEVSGLLLTGTDDTHAIFDLDWDNTGPVALQSNRFDQIYFDGGGYGVRIGNSGYMGSENDFLDCFFANAAIAGLFTNNYNALQNSVRGGNFQGCVRGIHVFSGSVPLVSGVGFQNQSAWDIDIQNTANDTYVIQACRTESLNFVINQGATPMTIAGCSQTNASSGLFYQGGGATLLNCVSVNGLIKSGNKRIIRSGCQFVPEWHYNSPGGELLQCFTSDAQQNGLVNRYRSTDGSSIVDEDAIIGGFLERAGNPGADFTDLTDTAANIINGTFGQSHLQDVVAGTKLEFIVYNTTAYTMTLDGDTGVTIYGANTIPTMTVKCFRGMITDAATPTIKLYAIS